MAHWLAAVASALLALPAVAQQAEDQQFRAAGVCSRCHVISVVEWGMSGHRQAGTSCVACHGSSQAHVADERNNVKPDRLPNGAAVAGLCASCHASGCPKTNRKEACQDCHHVHALVDPNAPPTANNEALETQTEAWDRHSQQMEEAERHFQAGEWRQARDAFRVALEERPGERQALLRLEASERRLGGTQAGFEIVGEAYDNDTGLPREVRVSGLGIPMVLIAGGEFEMGSEKFPSSTPVHTVRVEPFYLAKYELTQAEWKAVVGDRKSSPNDRMPVHEVSWEDAQTFLQVANQKITGGGFRLPTEAEWEFAARAGAAEGAELAETAWFGASEETGSPEPVGTKKPNRLGLFDMQGNVWEWCSSLGKPYPYDATDGRESPQATGQRALRGGGYADPADLLDPRMRHAERPNRRLRWNGMRLARSVPEIEPKPTAAASP